MSLKPFLLISCLLLFRVVDVIGQEKMLCQGHFWTEDEANLKMKEFALNWNDIESWERRVKIIRKGILDGMQFEKMPKVKGNFNPVIRDKRIMDGYSVENIALESFPGFYITGNLYLPLELKDKNPAVICTHGHKSNRGETKNLQLRCASLARMGAIVFSLNSIGKGVVNQVSHKIPIGVLLQTWNSKRALDYLVARTDVDAERIGMTGESGGGTQTFLLAAIDDRLKVSVPVVQVSAHFFGGCVCEAGMPIHRSKNHQTNNVEIAATFAPKPMLIISDGADVTNNTPIVEYPYIQKVYSLYNAEHKVKNVHLALEKHDYGYSKRAAAYIFLSHHLQLDLNKIPYNEKFNENFATILDSEELQVFTEKNPLPENALMGDIAIMDFLNIYAE